MDLFGDQRLRGAQHVRYVARIPPRIVFVPRQIAIGSADDLARVVEPDVARERLVAAFVHPVDVLPVDGRRQGGQHRVEVGLLLAGFGRSLGDANFEQAALPLQRNLQDRKRPQMTLALRDPPQQKRRLEQHPRGVFHRPPRRRGQHAEDRFRPEQPANQMIDRHQRDGRQKDPPITIERQDRQRTEHVKMGLDPPPRQVDQQRRVHDLG